MTLPPDPTQLPLDNSDDPLGGMDPLAWLESLAKRQGVDASQLTTAANLEIAMPPADAVVDGPGYTPGYDVRPPAEPVQAAPSTPIPIPTLLSVVQPTAAVPASAAEIDPMTDPIAWMESLARRQGGDESQFTTAANLTIAEPPADAVVDGPDNYTPGYDVYPSAEAEPVQAAPAAPIPTPVAAVQLAVSVPTPAAEIDPMTDPIAWMESLARRQGGDESQFTTAANLTIAEPPADAVVDGPDNYTPGYDVYPTTESADNLPPKVAPAAPIPPEPARTTPFVPARFTPFVSANPPPAPIPAQPPAASFTPPPSAPVAQPIQSLPVQPPVQPPIAQPVTVQPTATVQTAATSPAASDLPDITDPLAWLESLTTPHPISNYEYTSPVDSTTGEPDNAMSADEALAWLDQLTRDSAPAQAPAEQVWLSVSATPVDTTGGLSNDMDELQKWLTDQARSLEDLHDLPEDRLAAEDAPARPVDPNQLPDWLLNQAPGDEFETDVLPLTQADQAGAPVGGLPDWLAETMGQPDGDPFGTQADALIAQPIAPSGNQAVEDEYDPWIEALEEEENRQRAGDDSIPDWYLEAMDRNGTPLPALDTLVADTVSSPAADPLYSTDQVVDNADIDFSSALLAGGDELPAWLAALNPDANPLASGVNQPSGTAEAMSLADFDAMSAFEGEIPDWLREAAPTPAETEPLSDLVAAPADELPDWLRGMGEPELPPAAETQPVPTAMRLPEPAPVMQPVVAQPIATLPPVQPPVPPTQAPPVQPVIRPVVQAAPPIAAQPIPAQVIPDDFDPAYHLTQAQYHADQQNYADSLGHYQKLIDKSASLDQVVQGVSAVIAAKPDDPRARRLLGDAHLRQGNLQAALDTYRSALDRL